MNRNPFLNALLATLYIIGIVFVVDTLTSLAPVETILIPMAVLSLFVLSAAVMGFLFLAEPLNLYFEGHRLEAVSFFVKTLGTFACFVVVFVAALLYTSL